MLSAIRSRITYVNVVATLVLVFAMTGGAYAAKKYLITSTKQISPSVLKALQGKSGAAGSVGVAGVAGGQGPQGPAGPAGANGKDGAPGAPGANGASGNTVLNGTVNPTSGIGGNGDFYLDTASDEIWGPKTGNAWPGSGVKLKGANGSAGNTVLHGTGVPPNGLGANGDFYIDTAANKVYGPREAGVWPGSGTSMVGPPGPEGVCSTSSCHLPSNVTEKGTWAFNGSTGDAFGVFVPISFNIPLAASLDAAHTVFVPGFEANPDPTDCDGSVASPAAKTGFLCVYEQARNGVSFFGFFSPSESSGVGADIDGALLVFIPETEPSYGYGSWAVTG